MKAFYILIIALTTILLSCQNTKPTENIDNINIEGLLPSLKNQKIFLVNSEHYFSYSYYSTALDSVLVDSTGYFSITWEQDKEDIMSLHKNNGRVIVNNLFLQPNDSLRIDIDTANNYLRTRKGSVIPNFEKDFNKIAYKTFNRNLVHSYPLEKYLNYMDSFSNAQLSYLENDSLFNTFPNSYKNYRKHNINQSIINWHLFYLKLHQYYAKGVWEQLPIDSFPLSIQNKINTSVEQNNMASTEYKTNFTSDLLTYENRLFREQNNIEDRRENLKDYCKIAQTFPDTELSTAGLLSILESKRFNLNDTAEINEINYLKIYLDTLQVRDHYKIVFDKIIKKTTKLLPGNKAPDFSLTDINGDTVTLSDFEGKVVYLDFWGTWCGPCVAGIPASNKIQERYKGKDVVFINIAHDAPKDLLEFLETTSFSGIQIMSTHKERRTALHDYNIKGYPTYMLIDKEGKLFSSNAKRPENEVLIEDIDLLLKMKTLNNLDL